MFLENFQITILKIPNTFSPYPEHNPNTNIPKLNYRECFGIVLVSKTSVIEPSRVTMTTKGIPEQLIKRRGWLPNRHDMAFDGTKNKVISCFFHVFFHVTLSLAPLETAISK